MVPAPVPYVDVTVVKEVKNLLVVASKLLKMLCIEHPCYIYEILVIAPSCLNSLNRLVL